MAHYHDGTEVRVGDRITFDHFGARNRAGLVVKVTPDAVSVEWTAPSSGKTRVVRLSTKLGKWSIHEVGNPKASSWSARNPQRVPTLRGTRAGEGGR